ncbi:LOW QUALITY PROTEIN: pentatricopeptide repeat-containing protein At3g51320-like [Actinidia eriantha]|uniref:LOW QUALITY PROTEIN: pentatricopeptide repeat-containing protein At3g51320-like n=1 Tax=Actinidia eriantha TaxID=165200 RepID=UPI00258EC616|nr:LOW QUALITY PROTEIN: pentatricopeptide repeat-containing protein At3g51320-like [Actinidia eriantha]
MARVSIRELLRSRNYFLSHPTLVHSKPTVPSPSSFCFSTSSDLNSENRKFFPLCHRTLNLVKTCSDMRQLYQIQAHLITCGLFQNPFLAGGVLQCAADFGEFDYTILVFRCIESPDTFCINSVIKAYVCSNVPQEAVVFYFEMLRNGFVPNSFTFPPLVSSCAKAGCSKLGQTCHGQAIKNGVDFVLPVENSLIHFYACCGLVDFSRKVFVEMSLRDMVSWNSIVDGYAKVGELGIAHKLFDEMPQRNVISWNVMITGYLNSGNPGCSLKLFRRMMKMGLRGSDTTMVSVLTACGRSARLKEGRSVHGSLIRTSLCSRLIIDTALIDMYSKCRRVDVANLVFDRTSVTNLICWNAMILGHCLHGNPEDGLNLYAKMVDTTCSRDGEKSLDERQELLPDEVTFVGILCACARRGLLVEGRNYFSQMSELFSIKPSFAHYWCMANLFAGVGQVQEALEIIRSMPVNEDVSLESLLWARLLGSCRFEGNVNLGEEIADVLIELESDNPSSYALLLNVYSVAGRWEDVARVKQMMKERGVKNVAGCSLFDLKEIVHNLKLRDKWQQHIQEVNMMMAELAQRLSLLSSNSQKPILHKTETRS